MHKKIDWRRVKQLTIDGKQVSEYILDGKKVWPSDIKNFICVGVDGVSTSTSLQGPWTSVSQQSFGTIVYDVVQYNGKFYTVWYDGSTYYVSESSDGSSWSTVFRVVRSYRDRVTCPRLVILNSELHFFYCYYNYNASYSYVYDCVLTEGAFVQSTVASFAGSYYMRNVVLSNNTIWIAVDGTNNYLYWYDTEWHNRQVTNSGLLLVDSNKVFVNAGIYYAQTFEYTPYSGYSGTNSEMVKLANLYVSFINVGSVVHIAVSNDGITWNSTDEILPAWSSTDYKCWRVFADKLTISYPDSLYVTDLASSSSVSTGTNKPIVCDYV